MYLEMTSGGPRSWNQGRRWSRGRGATEADSGAEVRVGWHGEKLSWEAAPQTGPHHPRALRGTRACPGPEQLAALCLTAECGLQGRPGDTGCCTWPGAAWLGRPRAPLAVGVFLRPMGLARPRAVRRDMSLGGAVTPVPWFPAAGDLAPITLSGLQVDQCPRPGRSSLPSATRGPAQASSWCPGCVHRSLAWWAPPEPSVAAA